jgi:diacylglycerol kinase family enzyme
MRRIGVVLNARAGALAQLGAAQGRKIIEEALAKPGRRIEFRLATGREMADAIAAFARGPHDTLIVGGGDGSVNCAAGLLAGSKKVLGVLPLGTMNLLAKDLGVPTTLEAAAAALARARLRAIDLAMLNGRPFHTLSGVGFFSQMARAREETRGFWAGRALGVAVAFMRAIERTGRFTLEIETEGRMQRIDAYAALVTNNRFDEDWHRARLDQGVLEVHLAEDQGAFARVETSIDLLAGNWRSNEGVHSFVTREAVIAVARRRAWVAIDGERVRERVPLRYAIAPNALNVLVP